VVRMEFFWLSKVECVHWQDTHKITGKEHHVTEELNRNEKMNGPADCLALILSGRQGSCCH